MRSLLGEEMRQQWVQLLNGHLDVRQSVKR